MNIAIFSPNKNPYSETFIQAHKNYLKGNVSYYYGHIGSIKLEGTERLVSKTLEFRFRLARMLSNSPYAYVNQKSILKSLKQNKIDVALIEYGTHAYSLISILKSSKIPFVVHFHGYDASVKGVISQCNNYKEVFSNATSLIAVSRKMEQMLLDIGCPRKKLIYNVYGAQPEFESVIPTFAKKQFIAIGRFTDKKAPYYTIMAFKEIADKFPDAKLLIAGDGLLLNMCENLVKHYQLEQQVDFLGVIKPEEYKKILTDSLAFVQHSITAKSGDMEGTPVAVLEASVAGLPVIATKHAGIIDVIKHGETGLLCDEHDVAAMSDHMMKVLSNIEFAKQMGSNGKKHIKQFYSLDRHINALQKTLNEAVSKDC
ncbi:glycosyltransferase [Winogradskyella ouciana]|uniref:glycosyltransferase n=1 Tax=Winogradskyella ouciana TaxID=2608631 RepID=UPI003D2D393D